MKFPHYKVEKFKTEKELMGRANKLYTDPDDNKQYYLYLFTEGPSGYTAVFAESRVPKSKE